MAEAMDNLEAAIDELGPFDGVLGFSQGGALTISYMHRQQQRQEPIPFKFALIFSSVMPCSADAEACRSVIQRIGARGQDVSQSLEGQSIPPDERGFIELLQQTIFPARKNRAMLPDFSLDLYANGDLMQSPRIMDPRLIKERIRIPTVHVTGKRDHDFMRKMSEVAHSLCEDKMTKRLEHSGGHHPPLKDAEVKAVIRAMEWAIKQSESLPSLRL
jgi:pimeloyl-ACP methyl ester carboxylesterase